MRALGLLFLCVALGCDDTAAPRRTAPPNIVVFVADDLGWNDVSYHGSEIPTPHLDRLARSGIELDAFYVLPVCSATRAAFLTGRHPIRYGFQVGVVRPWSSSGLPVSETLLSEDIARAGYATHCVGKWHLGASSRAELPTSRGFEHHYGQYTGLVDYHTHERLGGLDWHRDGEPARDPGHATALLRDEAVRIVREHDQARPLFLYLPFSAPHYPLQPDPRDLAELDPAIEGDERRSYAALVRGMDRAIGAVLAALDERGMREETLVLFFSDNGALVQQGGSNAPLRGAKSTLYEGGVRVPAIVSWPGTLAGGRRLDTPLSVVDWRPTLARLAGLADVPVELDGLDLWPHLEGGAAPEREALLINTQRKHGALRAGRHKLVVAHHLRRGEALRDDPRIGIELFDLASDPTESRNLAAEDPETVARLSRLLESYHRARRPPFEDRGAMPEDFEVPTVWGPRD